MHGQVACPHRRGTRRRFLPFSVGRRSASRVRKDLRQPGGTSHSQRYTSGSRALTASYSELAFERTGLWPSARNQRALAILAGLIRVAARLTDAAPRKGEPGEAEQNHRPGGGLRRGDEVHTVRRVEPGQQRRLDVASVRIHQRHFVEAADRDDRRVGIEPAEPDLFDKVRVRFGDMEPARSRFRKITSSILSTLLPAFVTRTLVTVWFTAPDARSA